MRCIWSSDNGRLSRVPNDGAEPNVEFDIQARVNRARPNTKAELFMHGAGDELCHLELPVLF